MVLFILDFIAEIPVFAARAARTNPVKALRSE